MRRDDWETPRKLFDYLDDLFDFEIDAAATNENALCDRYFTEAVDNALTTPWNGRFFCNPPYSLSREFAARAMQFSSFRGAILLPVRSDRHWFQQMLHDPETQHCWITGRLHFGNSGKGAFMYSILFYWNDIRDLPEYLDASNFNANGKGGAKS